jgi:acetylornithine deacetylase/succinyl-diaminopimelate desuccinylase-like protein
MKLDARKFAWLLPVLLSGCAHNANLSQTQFLAPNIDDTPPPPSLAPATLPSPVITIPKTDKPVIVVQERPTKEPPKHKKTTSKTAGTPANSAAGSTSTQVADNAPPSEVNAVGNFTTPPEAPDSKKLAEVEKGLNGISHKLTDSEEKTSMQIKELLKEARTQLNSGDVDAANTLAKKAKALLGELSP